VNSNTATARLQAFRRNNPSPTAARPTAIRPQGPASIRRPSRAGSACACGDHQAPVDARGDAAAAAVRATGSSAAQEIAPFSPPATWSQRRSGSLSSSRQAKSHGFPCLRTWGKTRHTPLAPLVEARRGQPRVIGIGDALTHTIRHSGRLRVCSAMTGGGPSLERDGNGVVDVIRVQIGLPGRRHFGPTQNVWQGIDCMDAIRKTWTASGHISVG
jgi:hypothetical protein